MFPEKAMAPQSSTLAWKIPWTEEPDGLQSMGSLGVGHDWATSLSPFTFLHWRRQWQLTPGFLPGESQGWGSLVGCRLWGHTESETTEATEQQQQQPLCSSESLGILNLEDILISKSGMFCSAEWRLFKKRDEWTLKWRTYKLVYVRAFLFFYSILCGDLNGKEILKRGNICICITD